MDQTLHVLVDNAAARRERMGARSLSLTGGGIVKLENRTTTEKETTN